MAPFGEASHSRLKLFSVVLLISCSPPDLRKQKMQQMRMSARPEPESRPSFLCDETRSRHTSWPDPKRQQERGGRGACETVIDGHREFRVYFRV